MAHPSSLGSSAGEPAYELLRASAPAGADALLRTLARGHEAARTARYSSRSYRVPLALVAWGDTPLGVDLERVQPCGRAFAQSICTPAELARFNERLDDDRFVISLWSGKEALAKALGDAVIYDPRRLESPLGWDGGAAGRWRAREFEPAAGHVAWLVWVAEGPGLAAETTEPADRAA